MSAHFQQPVTQADRDGLRRTESDLIQISMFAEAMVQAMATICTRHPSLRACQDRFSDAVKDVLREYIDEPLGELHGVLDDGGEDAGRERKRDYWWHMGRV